MSQTRVRIDVIERAVALACRAPSVHNSQPWRWVLEGADLRLFAATSRTVPFTDISGREAMMSCGAVLDHLRVAMAAAGWDASVERFPNPNSLDHLASIHFGPREFVTTADRDRADAILRRRTDRLPFAAPSGWEAFEPVLRSTVDNSVATLSVIADDARRRLAEASRLTEATRRYDATYHAELAWWTADLTHSEGIPRTALVSKGEAERVDIEREFPHLQRDEARRPGIQHDEAKILVLSTDSDDQKQALGCGEVLSTVLLECTMAQMATCTLTHMIEVEASRDIARELSGTAGLPQVLIRVGTAPQAEEIPPPTPRRAVREVLEIRE